MWTRRNEKLGSDYSLAKLRQRKNELRNKKEKTRRKVGNKMARYEYDGEIFEREEDVYFYISDNIGMSDLFDGFNTLLRNMDDWDFYRIWSEFSDRLKDEILDATYEEKWKHIKEIEEEDN